MRSCCKTNPAQERKFQAPEAPKSAEKPASDGTIPPIFAKNAISPLCVLGMRLSEVPQSAYICGNPDMQAPVPGSAHDFADRAPKCHRGRKDESHDRTEQTAAIGPCP
jgi:hypothetical protein